MKEAIAIQVGDKRVPSAPEFEKSLWELSKKFEYPILKGFLPDNQEVPDLQKTLEWLNNLDSLPDNGFKTKEELKTLGVNPVISAPAKAVDVDSTEESSPAQGAFVSANDTERARMLRAMITTRFTRNTPDLPDCRDNEIRLGKIYEAWGTGLSRTAISRHIKAVVETLTAEGKQIISSAGRYRLVPE